MMPYTDDEVDWVAQPSDSGEAESVVAEDDNSSNVDAQKLADWQARVWTTPEAWGSSDPKL